MSRPMLIAVLAGALAVVLAPSGAGAADTRLRGLLNAGSVVSATESLATGEARAMLEDDNDMRVDLVYSGLEERATGVALHVGKPSENGALVEKLDADLDTDGDSGRVVGAQFKVSTDIAARIRAGEAYLVITTIEHPAGLIRGQLTPEPIRLPPSAPALPEPKG